VIARVVTKENMFLKLTRRTLWLLVIAAAVLPVAIAGAQELTVMTSGGFAAPVEQLTPKFEASSGLHVVLVRGASMGTTTTAIPMRLARNEPADVVIMARSELDSLARKGFVIEGSQVDLVRSRIGMAVKAGAPVPDISTVAAFKRTLLAAKSIAYSDSASGVYISSEMYKILGIEDAVAPKSRRILGDPVGGVVAKGDVEIGFQQLSELKPIAGITIVGPIPDEVQKVTIFSAGVVTSSRHKDDARAFIHYLASAAVCPVIVEDALEPTACVPGKK
jgi:molybdate transport system substrate-binding protein